MIARMIKQLCDSKRWLLISAVMTGIYPVAARADNQDVFNAVLGSSYMYDSNFFRLPSGVDPRGPGSPRWENILTTTLGIKINKQYSLQTFQLDFNHVKNKYDNATYLNFDANNYRAAWLWSLTPYLKGTLSADRTESLYPFLDYRNTDTRNLRVIEMQAFDFDWSAQNNWHLIGRFSKLDATNSQTFLPETSFKLDTVEGGVKYYFPSQSYFSFVIRDSNGQNQNTDAINLISRDFKEKQEELKSVWLITGKSTITTNLGHMRREDGEFTIRDFSGYFGGIAYAWDVTGKVNVTASLSRKLSAFLDSTSSYTSLDTFNITPSWYATSKITVRANFQASQRTFKGDGPGSESGQRVDDGLTYGIGVDWAPRSTMKFGVNLQRDRRDSNAIGRDYISNTASINGQLTF